MKIFSILNVFKKENMKIDGVKKNEKYEAAKNVNVAKIWKAYQMKWNGVNGEIIVKIIENAKKKERKAKWIGGVAKYEGGNEMK